MTSSINIPNRETSIDSQKEKTSSGDVRAISAKEIRFSQTSVNGADRIIESMKENGWEGDPIDVVMMNDGKLTTLDNTRLFAARVAGIDVYARVHQHSEELADENLVKRFATPKDGLPKTWGEAVDFRIRKQNRGFSKNYSNGSYNIDNVR